jgi:hypothetical protein
VYQLRYRKNILQSFEWCVWMQFGDERLEYQSQRRGADSEPDMTANLVRPLRQIQWLDGRRWNRIRDHKHDSGTN